MRVILEQDIIVRIANKGIDVGAPPGRGVGLNRLRYDSTRQQLVDLAAQQEFWVEQLNGKMVFHCREFPGCQRVEMDWRDRKRLAVNTDGRIYLRTLEEFEEEKRHQAQEEAKHRRRSRVRSQLGDVEDQFEVLLKMNFLLMRALNELLENALELTPPASPAVEAIKSACALPLLNLDDPAEVVEYMQMLDVLLREMT